MKFDDERDSIRIYAPANIIEGFRKAAEAQHMTYSKLGELMMISAIAAHRESKKDRNQ